MLVGCYVMLPGEQREESMGHTGTLAGANVRLRVWFLLREGFRDGASGKLPKLINTPKYPALLQVSICILKVTLQYKDGKTDPLASTLPYSLREGLLKTLDCRDG